MNSEEYTQSLWMWWYTVDHQSIREEWEVTSTNVGEGYPPYRFVFGNPGEARFDDPDTTPKQRAEAFVQAINKAGGWPDPPRMRKRLVITTDWEDA